eukprot:10048936-Alexandrium_andersonii.AAC.1
MEIFDTLSPQGTVKFTEGQIEAVTQSLTMSKLSTQRLLCNRWCHAWGMAPNKIHVGVDILGLAAIRIQTVGFRQ